MAMELHLPVFPKPSGMPRLPQIGRLGDSIMLVHVAVLRAGDSPEMRAAPGAGSRDATAIFMPKAGKNLIDLTSRIS
ncbi:hypothetical protein J7426_14075 [Tropicibacter sp. R16_0]|uniref:hypothetical protein n=1 Tax=Tropicibacter sp. R16_0 TaxID=2821102 RepID=UPI001ADAACC1|nr:hypothetical protein [Tropicibacter sp. R16_0]MBO9451396.1 hypothetical protein [Tropicibacter sp. R16_0]